jgi:hypothetical protein
MKLRLFLPKKAADNLIMASCRRTRSVDAHFEDIVAMLLQEFLPRKATNSAIMG